MGRDDVSGKDTLKLKVALVSDGAQPPEPGVPSAAVAFRASESATLGPLERRLISTGTSIALPGDYAGFAIPMREMASQGLRFANSPGLIDNGYRGDVAFVCTNMDAESSLCIEEGQTIGWIIVRDALHCDVVQVEGGGVVQMDGKLAIKPLCEGLETVMYAHERDNGLDLRSALDVEIAPLERVEIPFGIGVRIPQGCIGFIQPRSGLSLREGLSIVDSPSVVSTASIDEELSAIFINLDPKRAISIGRGERIAQLVISSVPDLEVEIVDALDDTSRSSMGFGSSGK
ncbi:MAG: dUTP diphosphatase [Coriobacteriales bacterium]|nr:dUTP diphosphatase [Coriobacteriales bacterium]